MDEVGVRLGIGQAKALGVNIAASVVALHKQSVAPANTSPGDDEYIETSLMAG